MAEALTSGVLFIPATGEGEARESSVFLSWRMVVQAWAPEGSLCMPCGPAVPSSSPPGLTDPHTEPFLSGAGSERSRLLYKDVNS